VDVDTSNTLNLALIAFSVLLAVATIALMFARRGQRSNLDPVLLGSALVVIAIAGFLLLTR
jgi:ABC-type dipeptide/oligopeptide/nickel transport system permease component